MKMTMDEWAGQVLIQKLDLNHITLAEAKKLYPQVKGRTKKQFIANVVKLVNSQSLLQIGKEAK